jgi:hypothetical protein
MRHKRDVLPPENRYWVCGCSNPLCPDRAERKIAERRGELFSTNLSLTGVPLLIPRLRAASSTSTLP